MAPPEPLLAAAPPTQQGTDIDGRLRVTSDGRLLADQELRQLFDYFLADADRMGLEAARDHMAAVLAGQGLSAALLKQALSYFDQYLSYRQALSELPASSTALLTGRFDELRAAYEARYALRRQLLGAEMAEGFFSREEAEDRFVLESQALMRDDSLSAQERQRQLTLLEQQLPADIRTAREQSRLALALQEHTQQLRQAQASDVEIQRMREELVGPAAASRLASLDQDRQQWQQRLQDYRRERDQILATPGLSPADQQAALDALQQAAFSAHELRRVQALERIAQQR